MKAYVQAAIDEVNTVLFDPDGHLDADRFDRFETFETARDEALCCLEAMIDEADYDDDDHRREILWMQGLLEGAGTIGELDRNADYRHFIARLKAAPVVAA